MSMINIDAEKCKKEGVCVLVCPLVFEQKEKGAVPVIAYPKRCFLCGHCVAFCPADAITHHMMDMDNFTPVRQEMKIEPERVLEFLRLRRSVRFYKKKPVPKEIVKELLEAARYAPSGGNKQSLHYIVVRDPQVIDTLRRLCVDDYRQELKMAQDEDTSSSVYQERADRLRRSRSSMKFIVSSYDRGEDPIFYHAPGLIVIYAQTRSRSLVEDSTLAAFHMMLMAEALGLGTCFVARFYKQATKSEAMRGLLDIPSEHEICMAFIFGYPEVRSRRLVDRKKPTVRWI